MANIFQLNCTAFGSFALIAFIASPLAVLAQQAEPQRKIEIRGKCFNSDNPEQQIEPAIIIATVRPSPGVAPVLENISKPKIVDGFFVIEFEYNKLIEELTIDFAGNFNSVLLKKLVCKQNMVIYPAAADSRDGVFNFPGYVSQFGAYRDIYFAFTKLGRTPEAMRDQFQARLLNMPEAFDKVRLPDLTPEEREEAHKTRESVLILYGLIPEKPPAAEACPPNIVRSSPDYIFYSTSVQNHGCGILSSPLRRHRLVIRCR